MLRNLINAVCLITALTGITVNATDRAEEFPNLVIIDHPLVEHKLTLMRDKETDTPTFRRLLREVAMLIGYEVTRIFPTKQVEVTTPLTKTKSRVIDEDQIVIVPILRAGLGMAEGLHQLIPNSREGHIGLYRDPTTKKAVEYFFKIPEIENRIFVVVDPMLATGNSAIYGIQQLKERGIPEDRIILMSLVAAPEGVRAFHTTHPGVKVVTGALDDHLNDHAYIVPGLGDAGDRLYGTK